MRIVVLGATGNVGTAVLGALAADPEVNTILGVARRMPAVALPRCSGALRTSSMPTSQGCFTVPTPSSISPG